MVKQSEHILSNPAVYCMSLYIASQNGNRDIAKYISELPIPLPSPEDMDKYTSFFFALQEGHTNIFKRICENKIGKKLPYINKPDIINEEIKIINDKEEIKIITDKEKIKIETSTYDDDVSIFEASKRGDLISVKRLLNIGVNVTSCDEYHNTPMHYAVKYKREGVIDLLLEYGTEITASRNYRDDTPLHFAAINGYIDIVEKLLKHKSPIDAKNFYNNTPLHFASQNGHDKVVELLMDYGANDDIENNDKSLAAFYASNIKTIEVFLNRGFDINCSNGHGNSLLHCAINNGKIDLAEYLIEKGINVSLSNKNGNRAIHLAAKRNEMRNIIKLLLMKGELIDVKNSSGESFLHEVIKKEYNDILLLLLPKVDIEAKTLLKETALHYACKLNNESAVQILLDKGADINAKDIVGQTPAALAKIMGNFNILKMLREKNTTGYKFANGKSLDESAGLLYNFAGVSQDNFLFRAPNPLPLGAVPKRIAPKVLRRVVSRNY